MDYEGYGLRSMRARLQMAANASFSRQDDANFAVFRDFRAFLASPLPTWKHFLIISRANFSLIFSEVIDYSPRMPIQPEKKKAKIFRKTATFLPASPLKFVKAVWGFKRRYFPCLVRQLQSSITRYQDPSKKNSGRVADDLKSHRYKEGDKRLS